MVSPSLQEVARSAVGAGTLSGDGVGVGEGEHPICGDLVRIEVRLDGDGPDPRVRELAWAAEGCPAIVAVAAASHQALVGVAVTGFESALTSYLDGHGGLARHEAHAKKAVLHAARTAVADARGRG